MILAEEVNGQTSIQFIRPRIPTDAAPIDTALDKCVYILWAYGTESNFNEEDASSISYHQANRGVSKNKICFGTTAECSSKKFCEIITNL